MDNRSSGAEGVDTNSETVHMVKLLMQRGPRISEVARELNVHPETVRFRYNKLMEKGFTLQATYDFEKLGMRRVIMLVELSKEFAPHARDLFIGMSLRAYVVGYERTIPEGYYVVRASVPEERLPDYMGFIQGLTSMEIFRSVVSYEFEMVRNVPMRAEFYDFASGVWDYDWSNPAPDVAEAANFAWSERAPFDTTDLLILQKLRVDGNRTINDVHNSLSKTQTPINYKTLGYHYREHVLGNGLIKAYSINWMGTRYSFELEKAMHRKHRYIRVDLFVREVSDGERLTLTARMNALPFLWAEAIGKNYWAQFAFPAESITEAFLYLEKAISNVKERARYFIMDQASALTFTLEASLYDEASGRWRFDKSDLLARFAELIIKIKSGAA